VLVVAYDLVDDEAQELLRELGVEVGRLREVSQTSDLNLFPSGIRRRKPRLGFVDADLLRDGETLCEQEDECGIDVVDALAEVGEGGIGHGRGRIGMARPYPWTPSQRIGDGSEEPQTQKECEPRQRDDGQQGVGHEQMTEFLGRPPQTFEIADRVSDVEGGRRLPQEDTDENRHPGDEQSDDRQGLHTAGNEEEHGEELHPVPNPMEGLDHVGEAVGGVGQICGGQGGGLSWSTGPATYGRPGSEGTPPFPARAGDRRTVPPMRVAFVGGSRWSPGTGRVANRSVVVEAGRIVAIDSGAGADVVVEVGDGLLTPGFNDAHVHPLAGGLRILTCDLTECATRAEAEQRIVEVASHLPAGEWLTGGGWLYEWFEGGCPSADLLDRLAAGRPAAIVVRDGHSTWVNRAALARAGITADTSDPIDGRIERLGDGSPQGTLHEGAMRLVEAHTPIPDADTLEKALRVGAQYLHSKGVTGWQDAWVTDREHQAYLAGGVSSTVVGALWWDRGRGLEQLPEIFERSRDWTSPTYRPTSVKLMLDGVCENFTAALSDPYTGSHGRGEHHTGVDFIDPVVVRDAVVAFDAAGLQCHFHAIGDRAVRSALDAVEAARRCNGWTGPIHHIAHLQIVAPTDVPRFAELRVAANCQPLWAANDAAMNDMTVPYLGPERAEWQYPFGSLARRGALLVMGSDWPVSSADVMDQLSVAMRRRPPGEDTPPVLGSGERLRLEQGITAFTLGSAIVNGFADSRGRIRLGNVADLVLLGQDPFGVPDPAGIEVTVTMTAGHIVFDRRNGL
jgi:predicted amidohydrolase YtcJ